MSTPRQLIKQLQQAGLQNRILPTKDLTSRGHNGAATFVPAITKLNLRYSHPRIGAGGSSAGLVQFLTTRLPAIAASRPYVEICVQPRNGVPPTLTATYAGGKKVAIDVGKMTSGEVEKQVNFLCDSMDGEEKHIQRGKPVKVGGHKGAARALPAWDPFTAPTTFKP
ncbi:hypothetical protein BDZ88DRAFT_424983 [Geranomyces variabilis]|nr:hypothetical protein BDZ88DRAFT_424983 [Geranomyces variabilis]KAJ3141203.1 39S ribosomal protein L51, mitochondrial [Geranomyces variabilis]